MRRPLVWRQLAWQPPLAPQAAASLLRGLSTLPGAPRLVLEAAGQRGRVSWRVGAAAETLTRVDVLLRTHLPGSRLAAGDTTVPAITAAGSLRLPGHHARPLRLDSMEDVCRSVLAALADAHGGEAVRLQVMLGARTQPRRAPNAEPTERRLARATFGEHGFGCSVRVAATASSVGRARQLVASVAAAVRGLEAPGVRVRMVRTDKRAVAEVRSPWRWPLWLSATELSALLGWPVGKLPLPGVPAAHPRLLPALDWIPTTGRVLGRATASDRRRPVALPLSDTLRHLHVLGPTGTGKSTLLAQLALSDMAAGRGLVVIDPKGDLVADLLARVPASRYDDVVVLDATDEAPVGINPLVGGDPDLRADGLLAVMHQLYRDSWGPRTHDILHACLLTLARRGDSSLLMVPLLLTNRGFRRSVVGSVVKADPIGLGSFWSWFDGISDAEREAAIAPLMNKLRPVLLRPGLRAVFGQRQPRFDLSEVFTGRRILLVSLAKGRLGQEGAALLGSVVVTLLWQAALARVSIPAERRHPVTILIDEVQDYLRLGDLGDALAQARSLGVGFTLAHQHLEQLPPSIRAAVLTNARSRVCFQLSAKDAAAMAAGSSELDAEDFRSLPAFEAYAQLLVGNTVAPWLSLRTEPLPRPSGSGQRLRARSRERYGQPLAATEAECRPGGPACASGTAWPDAAGGATVSASKRELTPEATCPVGLPSGSRIGQTNSQASGLQGESTGTNTPPRSVPVSGSAGAPAGRVGARVLARLEGSLAERDRAVLKRIEQHRYLSAGQLQRFVFRDHASQQSAARTTRRVLARLERWSLLRPLGRRIGGVRAGSSSTLWQLAPAGIRLVRDDGAGYRTHEPSARFLAHCLAVADVHLALRELAWAGAVEDVRVDVEPACWRRYTGPGGEPRWLQPDLYARVLSREFEDRWFVEVDLSTESLPTLLRKCAAFEAYRASGQEQESGGVFPLVLWVVPGDERAGRLRTAIGRSRTLSPELHRVTTFGHVADAVQGAAP